MRTTLPALFLLCALCCACGVFSPSTPAIQTVVVVVTATPVPVQPPAILPAIYTRTPTVVSRVSTPTDTPVAPTTIVPVTPPPGNLNPTGAPSISLSCSGRLEDADKIGLRVASFVGGNDAIEFVIDGKPYQVQAMNTICIDLNPGKFAWTATRKALGKGAGTVEVGKGIVPPVLNLCAPEGQLTDRCAGSGNPAPVPSPTPTKPCCAMLTPVQKIIYLSRQAPFREANG